MAYNVTFSPELKNRVSFSYYHEDIVLPADYLALEPDALKLEIKKALLTHAYYRAGVKEYFDQGLKSPQAAVKAKATATALLDVGGSAQAEDLYQNAKINYTAIDPAAPKGKREKKEPKHEASSNDTAQPAEVPAPAVTEDIPVTAGELTPEAVKSEFDTYDPEKLAADASMKSESAVADSAPSANFDPMAQFSGDAIIGGFDLGEGLEDIGEIVEVETPKESPNPTVSFENVSIPGDPFAEL